MRRRLIVGLIVVACNAPADPIGAETAWVQTEAGQYHYRVVTTAETGPIAIAQRATGVVLVPRYANGEPVTASDGTPIRSTCGVTFVDRTHAITAAHCADDTNVPDPATRPLAVELIDVDPDANWATAAKLTGTFPDYRHPTMTTGYRTTTLTCSIVHRCSFGLYECPAEAKDTDIMMLECPAGLPADREPVAIASDDDERGPVSLFWFHEIYDAPMAPPPPDDALASDLFAHYTVYDPEGKSNFHYFGNGRNQLLPLVSKDWKKDDFFQARSRLRRTYDVVWTDLFGCHGTSGSGVMQLDRRTNRYQLLGPVAQASGDWGGTRLCTDPATHRPGVSSLAYTATMYSRALHARAEGQPPVAGGGSDGP